MADKMKGTPRVKSIFDDSDDDSDTNDEFNSDIMKLKQKLQESGHKNTQMDDNSSDEEEDSSSEEDDGSEESSGIFRVSINEVLKPSSTGEKAAAPKIVIKPTFITNQQKNTIGIKQNITSSANSKSTFINQQAKQVQSILIPTTNSSSNQKISSVSNPIIKPEESSFPTKSICKEISKSPQKHQSSSISSNIVQQLKRSPVTSSGPLKKLIIQTSPAGSGVQGVTKKTFAIRTTPADGNNPQKIFF